MTTIAVPDPALILLVGIAGCGKSTFAAEHFRADEVLSSDECRELVSGDPNDQSATGDAFDVLNFVTGKRLKRRRLTVIDATNLSGRERARFIGLAQKFDVPTVAVVLDLPFEVCLDRDANRADRTVGEEVLRRQYGTLRENFDRLHDEPHDSVTVLDSTEEVAAVEFDRRGPSQRSADAPDGDSAPPPAVVIDLDGTLASNQWREHFVDRDEPDWHAFFASMEHDAPVPPLVELTRWLSRDVEVIVVTGRPADWEPTVRRWLGEHGVMYDELFMRPADDHRPDHVMKRHLFEDAISPRWNVRLVVDDRDQVVEMWRDQGLCVLAAEDPDLSPVTEADGS